MTGEQVLTTHKVARHCQVTMATVVNWVNDGSLKAFRTKGGHRRIERDDLIKFLKENDMPFRHKTRILVVDDDQAIRVGLKKIFESQGFEVDLASDGFGAGRLLVLKKPDVVILDLVMPGMDGFEVCKYIKKAEGLKHTKIIILTGYPSKENIAKAKRSGAHRCLAKPLDNDSIVKEVQKLLHIFKD